MWIVEESMDDHTHKLNTPTSVVHHCSHKTLHKTEDVRELIDNLDQEGLCPSPIAKVVNVYSSLSNQTITRQQCIDYLKVKRNNNLGHKVVAIMNHFQNNKDVDLIFYFTMQIEEEKTLRNIFWAGGRLISQHMDFGDVIVFDVIYRTNKFSMSFALFLGVNHHRQSIIFGCALLSTETEDTFIWLFTKWLACMSGKHPATVNLCRHQELFPNTKHWYCSWHVDKHLNMHVPLLRFGDPEFKEDYDRWFNSESLPKLHAHWDYLCKKYMLNSNKWLMSMYKKGEHWVPVYWRNTFISGTQLSQMSECMNQFFDGYVTAATPLSDFITQYEAALVDRWNAEKMKDFVTSQAIRKCKTELNTEMEAFMHYTRKMFASSMNNYSGHFLLKQESRRGRWNEEI